MGDYGVKISQSGNDVKTANKENLVFSSKYKTLLPYMVGYAERTVPAADAPSFTSGHTQNVIRHGLGYKPLFQVFCTHIWGGGSDEFAPYAYKGIGAISPDGGQFSVDDNYLYIDLYNGDPTGDRMIFFKFHIFYNEA